LPQKPQLVLVPTHKPSLYGTYISTKYIKQTHLRLEKSTTDRLRDEELNRGQRKEERVLGNMG